MLAIHDVVRLLASLGDVGIAVCVDAEFPQDVFPLTVAVKMQSDEEATLGDRAAWCVTVRDTLSISPPMGVEASTMLAYDLGSCKLASFEAEAFMSPVWRRG